MRAPLSWLREYVDITLPPQELARRLTMAGLEVKEVQGVGSRWENVFIGQILAVNPHPNADRLRLATVDFGAGQETVVCGAPNLQVGDKIAFARVGAELRDGHTGELSRLKPAKIRGVVSSGMICSQKELGISESHEGIMVLPPDAPLGKPLADYLGDTIFDLEVTPNRADCLSVIGIARELAALTGPKMRIPEISYEETGSPIEPQIFIEIVDPQLCSRYCASLITGVKITESPKWMQDRLLACGMRPINNVVDITNYVMLEYGQPLHAFDYEKLRGRKIIVRRAREGEGITSLDGTPRDLSPDTLVIADESRAVAIAGVMGGANSEVSDATTSILLESANFNAISIHYTSRKLQLVSEASMRFERGIRPGLTEPAIRRATQLMIQLANGKAAKGVADAYPGKRERAPIKVSTAGVDRLLGVEFGFEQIIRTLTSLGFSCKATSASEALVEVPYWRGDIQQTVDLAEEVARIIGYDKIPTTMLSTTLPPQAPDPIIALKRRLRQYMVGYGFQEVITYSLSSLEALNKLTPEPRPLEPAPLRLANPMTAEQAYLRPHLRTNLLLTLAQNRRHEDGGIRLFELDKIYLPRERDLPEEPEILCAILNGNRVEKSWLATEEPFSFFDAKGMAEGILEQLGVTASFEPGNDEGFHPVRQATIMAGGHKLGVVGELHPRVLHAFEISSPVYQFGFNVTALAPITVSLKKFRPVPRFPGVVRDIALVVDYTVTHRSILDIVRSFPLVKEVCLFDVYSGGPVAPGKKSLAYRMVYQSDHTLTDDEVNKVQQQVLDRLAKELGAVLRA
ncbi:MAG: phenylalanine--tRNA ligase subunit beta [Chloroflexi bacterium]|nr:phenylalanine--tRNA ligase subunit beta [Chloroflexota bacterium]